MKKILTGVVVLDLTRFFSGPQCTLILAGMGAEVIKIDDPKTGDPIAFAPPYAGAAGVSFTSQTEHDMGLAYLKRARGKKSITIDLKSERGREIFLQLVTHADVVVENFSVGVAKRLGIDYQTLKKVNPRIIYCALTGYGSTGPDQSAKAYDLMVQAAVGLMSLSGDPEGPPAKAATPMSDAITGIFASNGITAALFNREKTGEGQSIDVAMADCLFSLVFDEPIDCYEALGVQARQGNRIMRFSPFNTYEAKDGWLVIGTATHSEWLALLDVMGQTALAGTRPELLQTSWRISNNHEIDKIVGAWVAQYNRTEVITILNQVGVPCSLVRSIEEVLQWQQLHEREMIVPLVNPLSGQAIGASGPGFPIKFGQLPSSYDTPAPIPGAHTHEILERFAHLSLQQIQELKEAGII
jgi:crotonobetainyl-CoA:carnitine CoA-transferase CaiB-like acyl-CoA transferase